MGAFSEMVEAMGELQIEANPAYPLNDIGTAKLFHDLCNETACYVPEAKSWYIFDGKRWGKDNGGLSMMELCKVFSQAIHSYAISMQADNDFLIKYATALQGRKRRESILRDACSIAPRSLSDFDNDKLLFNCQNGTLNLSTMTMQPHNPSDYLTKLSGAFYDKDAKCSRWEQFIAEVMQGDTDTARFLQKSFGYCLSGETSLECFFILYGSTTRNGKTTVCETVSTIMGEYARTAQPETLARRSCDGSSPTPDIARLKGARFLNMPEPERGLELNAALIKQLTGGDTYTGRFLHENPVLKLEGLTVPNRVLQATREYRQETDIVGTFLNDTLMEASGCRVPTATLYRQYTQWIKDNGYRPLNSKNFVGELRRRYDIRRDGVRGNEILDVDFIPSNAPWRDGC